jgi:hypothetical protein
MNKDLNLVEILKDCPKGTKLYSTLHGEVEVKQINTKYNPDYPITFKYKDKDGDYSIESITVDGRFASNFNGECILFPSKDQRDWYKFKVEPKFDISTLQPFDKVLGREEDYTSWHIDFYEGYCEELKCFGCAIMPHNQCIPYNDETKHLLHTTELPPEKYITWKE